MPENADLTLTTSHQQSIDLNNEHSPTLLYFWGTWCGVCSISSPTVNELSKTHTVISIAVKSGTDKELNDYMISKGYDFKVVNDSDGLIFNSWQGQVTPSYVIINNGKMTQGMTGIQPLWSLKLRMWLSRV